MTVNKILQTLILFFPYKRRRFLRKIIENLETSNKKNEINRKINIVVNNIKNKIKASKKINIAFLIYNNSKWKCQSIYDILCQDERFYPYIAVTKIDAPKDSFDIQTNDEFKETYNFFKNKGMNIEIAYNSNCNSWIPLEDLKTKPDIVYYCEPWAINQKQFPSNVNNYALTCYSPYFIPDTEELIECNLDFHNQVEFFYVLNESVKKLYSSKMQNKGINLKAVGHPILDYFYLNKDKTFKNKKTIIYAPHYSVDSYSSIRWGTFLKMGDYILNWAKSHREYNYVFKPHPSLKKYLLSRNLKTKEYVENYWAEWSKIGNVIETGDYLDIFMESCAMITDSGSFKVEYFMTQKPLIYLKNKEYDFFNDIVKQIIKTAYTAKTTDELGKIADEVIAKGNDYKKEERLELYKNLNFINTYAAKNIVEDIKKILNIV